MKRLLQLNTVIVFIAFFSSLWAQEKEGNDQQKIVKVCTLNSSQANQEFQQNVQRVRLQRQQVIELKTKIDATETEKDKEELQKELDTLLKKLNENNDIMIKNYGFSLTRNYTMVIEKSHIYMLLSEEEAQNLENAQESQESSKE